MSEKELTIRIRSPSLEETLVVHLERDATVASLKQAIRLSHPQQPTVSDQRIIYSGRLLEDTERMESVLSRAASEPIFHLVLKPSTTAPVIESPTVASPSPPTPPRNPVNPVSHNGYQLLWLNGQYFLAPVLAPTLATPPAPEVTAARPGRVIQRGFSIQLAWVNHLWLILKLAVVLLMVCQGASVGKIVFYHVLALLFFAYQTGRFSGWRMPPARGVYQRGVMVFFASLWPLYNPH
ncbi:hypothetical protein BY458DRAFT_309707 [Sporodiniella umbellata]|nr:hypothetical protein BY458DRAFT_309707 [Sporodiniella umbellata]